jgi:hypothetical protein
MCKYACVFQGPATPHAGAVHFRIIPTHNTKTLDTTSGTTPQVIATSKEHTRQAVGAKPAVIRHAHPRGVFSDFLTSYYKRTSAEPEARLHNSLLAWKHNGQACGAYLSVIRHAEPRGVFPDSPTSATRTENKTRGTMAEVVAQATKHHRASSCTTLAENPAPCFSQPVDSGWQAEVSNLYSPNSGVAPRIGDTGSEYNDTRDCRQHLK